MSIETGRQLDTHDYLSDDPLPFYPILSLEELQLEDGTFPDLEHLLPLDVRTQLDTSEIVVHIATPNLRSRSGPRSTIAEMIRLSHAPSSSEIGYHGGPIASIADEINEAIAALRRFEVLHGRDAERMALDVSDYYPKLLETTLLELAETQGVVDEAYEPGIPFRQEEKGRIILLARDPDDPIGKKFSDRLGWGTPFYGSIDATPTFISAIKLLSDSDPTFLQKSYIGRDEQQHTMKEALDNSLVWLINKLDETPDGLLEFKNTADSGGMDAQAWKDSSFAYLHANGSRANHRDGIASVEVQALAYDALLDAADIHRPSNPDLAFELEVRAEQLRKKIIDVFWIEDDPGKGSYFALATDHDPDSSELRPLKVRSSNMGRLLNSRLLERDDTATRHMRDTTVEQLFDKPLLKYSGIATLASDEVGFREGGYHTGSVWLWDTLYIADGLERHGFDDLAWNLRARVLNVANQTGSFPEFVRGASGNAIEMNPSDIYVYNQEHDILYLFEQVPQEIQGWTVSGLLRAKRKWPAYTSRAERSPSPLEARILSQILPTSHFR